MAAVPQPDRRASVDDATLVLRVPRTPRRTKLFDPGIVRAAVADSFRKLDPRVQAQNPVMFVVLVGAVLVTVLLSRDAVRGRDLLFDLQIALWLWFTLRPLVARARRR